MTIRLLAGDCRTILPTLPADSVHCVVTSPPYYSLRDYGTAQWDGGDAACDHREVIAQNRPGRETPGGRGGTFPTCERGYRDTCGKCGARRVDRQIGLEATPDEYLATMVAVFREVRRVLRPDGTCWVNIGDSYNGAKAGNTNGSGSSGLHADGRDEASRLRSNAIKAAQGAAMQFRKDTAPGLAAKQLLLMPARLALALQADGWWVRSDIIWHKPNPMPESCTDRPTSAHEHVFLLTKRATYFYDQDAIRWQPTGRTDHTDFRRWPEAHDNPNGYAKDGTMGRNERNVWTIATHAFPSAHFATFPPELASRCIRAGTSERGVCAQCGAPWTRTTERGAAVPLTPSDAGRKATWTIGDAARDPDSRTDTPLPRHYRPVLATGWVPSCPHDAQIVPATVLDPFFGAGTTGLVASRLQRDCIGIDLNPDYNFMARARIEDDAPLFAQFPVADPADERMADLFATAAD